MGQHETLKTTKINDMESQYIDPSDSVQLQSLGSLPPIEGYCFFIDISGSTALKDRDFNEWVRFIHNTFANVKGYFYNYKPLKTIGDCLMYFIPETEIQEKQNNALHIFSCLCEIAKENDDLYCDVKIGVAYCKHAYAITFIKGTEDVYGKDIDLAARLLNLAHSNEIVMNTHFYTKVNANYESTSNKNDFTDFKKILGPEDTEIKGFSEKVEIYKVKPN